MRTLLLLTLATMGTMEMAAQPYLIGSRSITYFDASRNRNIGTQLRYPGETAGADAVVLDGEWPVLVMGHGFAMTVGAYANLWDYFVPRGYIMVLPTTEGGLLPGPNHGAFGLDLAFLAEAMQDANLDPTSPFFGKVAPATALMGHSMGGGASFLGAANNTSIQTLVNFAPAETNPSAISAAPNVLVPTMVFAGSADCVTPIADHQGPMYAALATDCRAFVNITGGGHCFFANSNTNCSLGELICPSPGISRAAQHSVINDFAGLWLDHFLKGVPGAFEALEDSLDLSTRVTADYSCGLTTAISKATSSTWSLAPVPTSDLLYIRGASPDALVRVLDMMGRESVARRSLQGRDVLDVGGLAVGTYRLVLEQDGVEEQRPFVVTR